MSNEPKILFYDVGRDIAAAEFHAESARDTTDRRLSDVHAQRSQAYSLLAIAKLLLRQEVV